MIGLFKGMATTMSHLFRPTFNAGYPDTPKVLPERSRSSFALARDDSGAWLCKSCGLCERNCPDGAIRIRSSKREDGPGRVLEHFEIDLGLCMYCGICVEACPSVALKHTGVFENDVPDRADTVLVLYSDEGPAGVSAKGGGES